MKYVIDTNVLIDYPEVLDEYEHIIPIFILEELDNLKRDKNIGTKVRRAINKILEKGNISHNLFDSLDCYFFSFIEDLDLSKTDNKILAFTYVNKCLLLTNDIGLYIKAKAYNIPVEFFNKSTLYKGYVSFSNSNIEEFENYKFFENQYIIFPEGEMVYREGKFRNLILPPPSAIKGLNAYQRCALDLLYSDIPINIIIGKAGSGKTKLAIEMAYYQTIEECKFEKIVLIRNPIGSGEAIGYLPGKFEEKVQMFFDLFKNLINEEVYTHLIERNKLDIEIPYYLKGKTFENSFIIVDEAEDLDSKIFKLIGTRVGKNSKIVFCGDIEQTESKFLNNNGLLSVINKLKGNKLAGIIYLEEDVRSEVSKVFSEL